MTEISLDEYYDAVVIDNNGEKVGGVGQVFLDEETGQPSWVTVRTGLFGLKESFVPLVDARLEDGQLHVAFAKEFIKDAPRLDPEAPMTVGEEDGLQAYYGTEDEPEKMPGAQQDQGASAAPPQHAMTEEPAPTGTAEQPRGSEEQKVDQMPVDENPVERSNEDIAGHTEEQADDGAPDRTRDRSFEAHPNSEFPQNPDAQNPGADKEEITQNSPEDDGENREWVAPEEHKEYVEEEVHVYPHQTDFADEADQELIDEAEKRHHEH